LRKNKPGAGRPTGTFKNPEMKGKKISISLPAWIVDRLDGLDGKSRSKIILKILHKYLIEKEKE